MGIEMLTFVLFSFRINQLVLFFFLFSSHKALYFLPVVPAFINLWLCRFYRMRFFSSNMGRRRPQHPIFSYRLFFSMGFDFIVRYLAFVSRRSPWVLRRVSSGSYNAYYIFWFLCNCVRLTWEIWSFFTLSVYLITLHRHINTPTYAFGLNKLYM